jgi:hypothetical protein
VREWFVVDEPDTFEPVHGRSGRDGELLGHFVVSGDLGEGQGFCRGTQALRPDVLGKGRQLADVGELWRCHECSVALYPS